jgi:hypothetical protein
MKQEEFEQILNSVLEKHTDQAFVSEQLAVLKADYPTVLADVTTATTKVTTSENTIKELEKANELLRSANLKLFTQVGEKVETQQQQLTEPPTENKDAIADLFDENGNLK